MSSDRRVGRGLWSEGLHLFLHGATWREVGRGWLFSQGVGRERWEVEESVRSLIGGDELRQGWGFIDSGFYFFCIILFYDCKPPRVLILKWIAVF